MELVNLAVRTVGQKNTVSAAYKAARKGLATQTFSVGCGAVGTALGVAAGQAGSSAICSGALGLTLPNFMK